MIMMRMWGNLGNHGDRPEVSQALRSGEGQSVRRSDTMDESAFYYAVRQEDGTVLRVARETSSIWRMFKDAFPMVCVMALAYFLHVLCAGDPCNKNIDETN